MTLFACLTGVLAGGFVLEQAARRIRTDLARSGPTIEQLIGRELDRQRDNFERKLDTLPLALPDPLGQWLRLCVAVHTFYLPQSRHHCFAAQDGSAPTLLRALLAWRVGPAAHYTGPLRQYPGVTIGELVVTPDLDREAAEVWRQMRVVLALAAGVLLLNLLVYLPVRRALRPTERILATLRQLEAGDLAARMPRPALVELRRISEGFDHLASRLQRTDRRQRQLAQRLLSVREQERRRLARELHDEFGQSLASIRAEAACAANADNATQASLDAIDRNAAQMMDNLQRILHQLRPVGLEEFGLHASLRQQVASAQRRAPHCAIALDLADDLDTLPDELTVSIYRIVQEGLANALRHAAPAQIDVRVHRDHAGLTVCVDDDGAGNAPDPGGSGLGVLGMTERVEALGGHFSLTPRAPHGMALRARFPPTALHPGEDDDDAPPAAG